MQDTGGQSTEWGLNGNVCMLDTDRESKRDGDRESEISEASALKAGEYSTWWQ